MTTQRRHQRTARSRRHSGPCVLTCVLTSVLAGVLTTGARAQFTPVPTYLVLGQSNAEGHAMLGTGPAQLHPEHALAQPQPNAKIFHIDFGAPSASAWEPLHAGQNTQTASPVPGRFGPEVSLGALLAEDHGDEIYIFKLARDGAYLASPGPGQMFPTWSPAEDSLFPLLLSTLQSAQAKAAALGRELQIEGIFWIQGSSDTGDAAAATAYEANLTAFIADLRALLAPLGTDLTTPFVISQTPDFVFDIDPSEPTCDGCFLDTVRMAEARVACEDRFTGLFDPSDLSTIGCTLPDGVCDVVHFDAQGQLDQGALLFEQLDALSCPALTGVPSNISVSSGGVQSLVIQVDPVYAGAVYQVLGTITGSEPGFPLDGLQVPLNADPYFDLTLLTPGAAPLSNSAGTLDGSGRAVVEFTLPPGSPAFLSGLRVHHAAILFGAGGAPLFASNAVGIRFLP